MNDVESQTAAAAYEAVRAEAEALPADQVIARGVNLDDAMSRLLGVVAALGENADLAARLQALPAAVFPPQHLERLPTLADALSYAHRRAKTEGATSPSAVVPFKSEIAAVLDSGEVWVVHTAGNEEPETLVVGMSFD